MYSLLFRYFYLLASSFSLFSSYHWIAILRTNLNFSRVVNTNLIPSFEFCFAVSAGVSFYFINWECLIFWVLIYHPEPSVSSRYNQSLTYFSWNLQFFSKCPKKRNVSRILQSRFRLEIQTEIWFPSSWRGYEYSTARLYVCLHLLLCTFFNVHMYILLCI